MIYRLPATLTVHAWERLVGASDAPFTANGTWSAEVREEGLHLDLSGVEFAYFDVLARVLLVLDAAVRDGVPARVVLPTAFGPDDVITARQARARGAAKAFMRDVGFLDALQPPHWPTGAVEISESESDPHKLAEVQAARGGQVLVDDEPPIRQRRIVPLHWVHRRDDAGLGSAEYFSAVVARLSELGLSRTDARAITYGVLTELVTNVEKHAMVPPGDSPPALVAAVLVDDDLFASRYDELSTAASIMADSYDAGSRGSTLQLLVGDSGTGLVPRLAPRLTSSAGHDWPAPAREAIMRAFDRWSAPPTAGLQRRETHGLWRVDRLVRSYQGAIVVHSAGTWAGRVHLGTDAVDVEEPTVTAVLPGTLVETILRLGDSSSRKLHMTWTGRSAVGQDARLDVVACSFDPEHGLGDNDRARLDDAARLAHENPAVVGVVATIPVRQEGMHLTENAMQTALTRALDAASSITHPVAVVLVFPDADPRLLDLSVSGINADEERGWSAGQGDRTRSPILVLGAAGPPLWCGGATFLCAMLRALTEAGGALSWDQVRLHWTAAGGDPDTMRRELAEHPRLVTATDTEVVLRISAADTVQVLAESAREQLASRIDQGGAGVDTGYFRTPTLRLTTRWIDGARLVETTVGNDLAALLLARRVEEHVRLDPSINHTVVVARTAMTSTHLAGQFSECLDLGGRYYTMPGELDLDGIPVSEQVPPHASVILCAGVISTENTARRAAAAIVSEQAVPVAIACVVDGRVRGGPIRIFNRDIPVLSLVTADVEPRPARASVPVDIDPLLRRPLTGNDTPWDRAPIPERTLLEWCSTDVDSLRLGHVERMPRMRHFSAYLRLDRLLGKKSIAGQLATAVRTTVQDVRRQWQVDTDSGTDRGTGHLRSSEIWHPGSRDDYAGRLARLVRDVLVEDGVEVVGLRSIPREVAGKRWTFPTSLDEPNLGGTVVVVDWGALSSISVQQMMRLAAEAGATAILALILLDQLEGQDSDALRAISAMRARRSGVDSHVVPAEVRFLARSSIGGLPTPGCSLCETRDRYEDYSRSAPRALREQALKLREYTRLRSREELFGLPAGDLFNVPVRGHDMADYLRWRGLLQRALGVTAARQQVLDHLDALATEPDAATEWTGHNLVRLTAAEQQWLKLPPLRFATARDLLADICVKLLRQSSAKPPWLRVQAVMVMALAQPDRFVTLMPELIVRVADEPVLVCQMLLECHRLVRKPLLDSPVEVTDLRMSLIRARDRFEAMRRERETDQVSQYLDVLKDLLAVVQHKTRQQPRGRQEAWDLLREDLMRYVESHSMEAAVLRVRDFVEDLPVAPPQSERSKEALSDWDQCRTQLSERALNNLPALTGILSGDYVSDRLGKEDQQRLLAVVRDDSLGRLHDVRDRLHDLVRRPWEPADAEWLESRRHLLDELKWWHRMFMATHLEGDTAALVVQLVSSAPADPYEHISALVNDPPVEQVEAEDRHAGEVRVFCPGPLLDNVLAHVMENVRHHALRGAVPRVWIGCTTHHDRLDIVIKNSGTHPGSSSGRGLRSLDEKLRPFGASVTGRRENGEYWTFATTVGLALWQGA